MHEIVRFLHLADTLMSCGSGHHFDIASCDKILKSRWWASESWLCRFSGAEIHKHVCLVGSAFVQTEGR